MRRNESIFDLADWLTDPPSGGPMQMWCVGGGLAAVVTLYGVVCCITRQATTLNIHLRGAGALGDGLLIDLSGVPAVTFGATVIFIGLFMHFQWFWGNHKRLFWYHEIGKYAAVIGMVAGTVSYAFVMITQT